MVKYQQMKSTAAFIVAMLVHASAFAGTRVVVPSLPEAVRPLAEVETNVVFDAGLPVDNLWRLTVELDASVCNSFEVVFGTDSDHDGVLVGGDKTNQVNNLPPQQGGIFLTGFTGLSGLLPPTPSSLNPSLARR